MYVENRTKIANFPTPVYLTPPLRGSPWNFVSAQGSQKTRVMGLSDGRKSFPIGLAVLIQYRSVTASQPATHVAVAITLNAQASSLKITWHYFLLIYACNKWQHLCPPCLLATPGDQVSSHLTHLAVVIQNIRLLRSGIWYFE